MLLLLCPLLCCCYDNRTDPDIFGLHENADMTCAQAESFELLETYLSLQKG